MTSHGARALASRSLFTRRSAMAAAVAALGLLLGLLVEPTNPVGYLARMGAFQAELLAGRVPVTDALADDRWTPAQRENLARVAKIKAFGAGLGLAASTNYDTISPDWDRQIWNLSACHPLAFQSKRWWFPIVGSMPYIGFFRAPDGLTRARALKRAGWDVYLRPAGAYSTLGWFSDPILPPMLDWDEADLAETVLHELTHATLWVPGSAQFNESFAQVVGEHAGLRWMEQTYGPGSPEVAAVLKSREDGVRYVEVLHALYADLDALYQREDLDRGEVQVRKGALYATLPVRLAAAGMTDERYARSVQRNAWNNARLVQFRTYNRAADWFEVVLAQEGGDLGRFIERIRQITADADDPWAALAEAAGVDPATALLGDG